MSDIYSAFRTKSDRIKLSEADEAIYRPRDEEVKSENYIREMYFTFSGGEDSRVTLNGEEHSEGYPVLYYEENNCYAKRVFTTQYKYYIKRGPRGTLLNPLDMYDEGKYTKVAHGLSNVKYSEVNKKAFMHYITFLKTKNLAHLRNAEREAI